MQVLIVYESMYGNTHEVAEAVADGIRHARAGTVASCVPVAAATADRVAAADLLIVGGPTHAHGMTSTMTRRAAAQADGKHGKAAPPKLDPDATGPGLRTWFHELPRQRLARRAAAFDTRLSYPLAGGAARGIGRRLREHGYALVVPPEGFIVEEAEGPMHAGELERARAWGASLVAITAPVG
jgi:flavodoxin-like protein